MWADKCGAAPDSLEVFWSACVKEAFVFLLTEHTERGFMCGKNQSELWYFTFSFVFFFFFKLLSGCIYVCTQLKAQPGSLSTNLRSLEWHSQNTFQTQHIQETQVTQGGDGASCSLLFHCLISQRLFNMQLTEHKEGSLPTRQLYFIILQSLQECTLF